MLINCFWVAGQYKGKGYAKALLQTAIDDALQQGKDGLVTVVGTKKFHFMSDTKWLLRQGFVACEQLPTGFSLLVKKLNVDAPNPTFNESARTGECPDKKGITVYFSNRCPFVSSPKYPKHGTKPSLSKPKQENMPSWPNAKENNGI